MNFERSTQGIKNYHHFYNVELVAFIEGKQDENITFDEMYYQEILPILTNKQSIKVKPVGNKENALQYLKKISGEKDNFSIVIVDKDLYGISTSLVTCDNLFTTYGYSWENDFWSPKLCADVINLFTAGRNTEAVTECIKNLHKIMGKVSKISAIDAALQTNAYSLLPKNGKSCGIKLSKKEKIFVSREEYRRHADKARENGLFSCKVTLNIYKEAAQLAPCKVIQGHLWEYICVTVISEKYKDITGNRSAPIDIIKNAAFSIFKSNPETYLDPPCIKDLQKQYSRLYSSK